jgi:hypothetical protein
MSESKEGTRATSDNGGGKNKQSKEYRSGTKKGNKVVMGSRVGIEELGGNIFQYGIPGQQVKYNRTKKAIADFVGITSDCGQELYTAIMEGVEPVFEEPEDPGAKATKGQLQRYDILLKKVLAKEEKYNIEKAKLFRLIVGQCSQQMRNKIEAMPDYKKLEKAVDFVELLKRMKEIVDGTDNTQYLFWKMQAQLSKLVFMKQEPNESVANYSKRFEDQVEATESVFGPLVPTFDYKGDHSEEQLKHRNKLLACLFLAGADRGRFKSVVDDLGNEFQFGKINYPDDVTGMTQLLTNRRGVKTPSAKQIEEIQDGVYTSFQQANSHPKLVCNYCGMKGHASEACYKRIADEAAKNKNSNGGSTSNTQGWFDDVEDSGEVTSFQYEEARAWFHEED